MQKKTPSKISRLGTFKHCPEGFQHPIGAVQKLFKEIQGNLQGAFSQHVSATQKKHIYISCFLNNN
jgi:hypothetical protein